jgi:S1-C subfamily serine protease
LVGINTAIFTPDGDNAGIGFAIPSNMAKAITEQLLKHGKVERGQLGIVVQNLTPELIQAFDIYVNQGAVVVQVLPNSAAKEDGLKVSKEVHLTLTVKNIIL